MNSAPRYLPHYTVADYEHWEGDWELWQGIPVAMSPSPFGGHQHCSLQIARTLLATVEAEQCAAVVLQDIDWIISNDTVVRPDVLALCGEIPKGHVTDTPALIVEILSPSTAEKDRNDKLRLYDDHGVAYYLIVDPNDKSLVYYARNEQRKLSAVDVTESLELTICGDCHRTVDVASFF